MVIDIQSDILNLDKRGLLKLLLKDRTTGGNILWATDTYAALGPDYQRDRPITPEKITGEECSDIIKTRARKELEQRAERTKRRGEVATPLWVCEKMIDYADGEWFGRKAGFRRTDDLGHIRFTQKRPWTRYVETTRLEMTCGEAPFLASRYDAETGEAIPVEERTGILDRKLRAVSENTADEADWLRWARRAARAVFGYEFQGDSLLIARVNLFMTVEEHFRLWRKAHGQRPKMLPKADARELCGILAWNVWQMDGLTGTIPYRKPREDDIQTSLFDSEETDAQPLCRVYDWRGKRDLEFSDINTGGENMKFDFIIGNPPYQEEQADTSDKPIYNDFMDGAYKVANKVELITPARFLFGAGKTPKAWNEKMLNDPHLKVLWYEQNSGKVFRDTDIKGGITITYRSAEDEFGAIEVFTSFSELNSIRDKVTRRSDFSTFSSLIYAPESYKFSEQLHIDFPELRYHIENGIELGTLSKGHDNDIVTNIFSKLTNLFVDEMPNDGDEYVKFVGLIGNKRYIKWIKRKYIRQHDNLDYYKVILPKSNGSGAIGEVLSTPLLGEPLLGHTQSFISIGRFDTKDEAVNALKYIKSKFARTMLGILKITQDNKKGVWKYVPLQDFTAASDIDWSTSVADIDRQLYAKYGLDEAEIAFIESHVKEMA